MSFNTVSDPSATLKNNSWMNRWTKKQISQKKFSWLCFGHKSQIFPLLFTFNVHPGLESQDYCSILPTSLTSVSSLPHWTFMSGKLLSTSTELKIYANLLQYVGLLSNILYFKHDLTYFNAFCCGNFFFFFTTEVHTIVLIRSKHSINTIINTALLS